MTNFKPALICASAVVALAVSAAPSHASTMRAVVSGVFQSGDDLTDVFGLGSNANLAGVGYTLTFDYDLDKPGIIHSSYMGSAEQASFGTASPIVSASISVNGHSEFIYGQKAGQIQISSIPSVFGSFSNFIQYSAQDQTTAGSLVTTKLATFSYYGFFDRTPIPGNLSTPYVQTLYPYVPWGQFAYAVVDRSTNSYLLKTDGLLLMNNITVSKVSTVPLPATLPLLGFGLVALATLGRLQWRSVAAY